MRKVGQELTGRSVVVSDGGPLTEAGGGGDKFVPEAGGDFEGVVQRLVALNTLGTPINCIWTVPLGVEAAPGVEFLKRLAEATGGTFTIVR